MHSSLIVTRGDRWTSPRTVWNTLGRLVTLYTRSYGKSGYEYTSPVPTNAHVHVYIRCYKVSALPPVYTCIYVHLNNNCCLLRMWKKCRMSYADKASVDSDFSASFPNDGDMGLRAKAPLPQSKGLTRSLVWRVANVPFTPNSNWRCRWHDWPWTLRYA